MDAKYLLCILTMVHCLIIVWFYISDMEHYFLPKFQAYHYFEGLCDMVFCIVAVWSLWQMAAFAFVSIAWIQSSLLLFVVQYIKTCSSIFARFPGFSGAYICMNCFSTDEADMSSLWSCARWNRILQWKLVPEILLPSYCSC